MTLKHGIFSDPDTDTLLASADYVFDSTLAAAPQNPWGIAPHPYMLAHLPPQHMQHVAAAHRPMAYPPAPMPHVPQQGQLTGFGAPTPASGLTTERIIIGVLAVALLVLLLSKSKSARRLRKGGDVDVDIDPKAGSNSIARIIKSARGTYYWKLMRKKAKKHGPYASRDAAVAAATRAGNAILGGK